MIEAWLNAPTLAINMNFEKFYHVRTFNGAKFEQNKVKIKLGKTRIAGTLPIDIVRVPIGTLELPIGTYQMPIGTHEFYPTFVPLMCFQLYFNGISTLFSL